MIFKRVAVAVLGVVAAALVMVATPEAASAARPQAVGVLPVASCGARQCAPGAFGVPVSAARSDNPNVTAALYRPGGTSQVFWVQTQAVTSGGAQVYDPFTGVAVYTTELVKPPTFNPPNGTTTGESQGFVTISPFSSSGLVVVPGGFPYSYVGGPFIAR